MVANTVSVTQPCGYEGTSTCWECLKRVKLNFLFKLQQGMINCHNLCFLLEVRLCSFWTVLHPASKIVKWSRYASEAWQLAGYQDKMNVLVAWHRLYPLGLLAKNRIIKKIEKMKKNLKKLEKIEYFLQNLRK